MFDLELHIKQWKSRCSRQSHLNEGVIAELESHLRDSIENHLESGLDEESAFYKAQSEIGTIEPIDADFEKNSHWEHSGRHSGNLSFFLLFVHNLKVSLRIFLRNKTYSLISILGLCAGLTISILIFLWGRYELNVNQFHTHLNNIHIICSWQQYGSKRDFGMGSPPAIGPALMEELPEVEKSARFQNGQNKVLLRYGEKNTTQVMQMADIELFDIFSFPMVEGDISHLKNTPDTIIISEKVKHILFKDEPAVGKIINLENKYDLTVIGVMKNIREDSTIDFDVWTSMKFMPVFWPGARIDTWYNLAFMTYIKVIPGTHISHLKRKIADRVRQSDPDTIITPTLYPFKNLYMFFYGVFGKVMLFGIFGLIVLSIACINFINLTTARSSARAKEIGIRKVNGATQAKLIRQFFTETFLIVFIATILALILVEGTLPFFNQYTGRSLKLNVFGDMVFLISLGTVMVFTGFLSGLYPAVILSSIKPVRTLRGEMDTGTRGNNLRKGLVVGQFTIAIILIISTLVMFSQENFMKTMDIGLDRDQIIMIPIKGQMKNQYSVFRHKVSQLPGVKYATIASNPPSGIYDNGHSWEWEGRDPALNPLVTYLGVDAHYKDTFRIQMTEGEFYSTDEESEDTVIINQTFADIMNVNPAVGKTLRHGDKAYTIKGVVKDFNFKPAWASIGPLVMYKDFNFRPPRYAFVKLDDYQISSTLKSIDSIQSSLNPGFPFEYYFLDELFEKLYQNMRKSSKLMIILSILAVFISAIGLYGLSLFVVEKRTKEIGIRKVMGADTTHITLLLSKDFFKWLLIANGLAWPAAWFLMRLWLTNFAYRITLYPTTFVITFLLTMTVAIGTISFQTIRAASANPVHSLRNE